jgi:hypothetical protein
MSAGLILLACTMRCGRRPVPGRPVPGTDSSVSALGDAEVAARVDGDGPAAGFGLRGSQEPAPITTVHFRTVQCLTSPSLT